MNPDKKNGGRYNPDEIEPKWQKCWKEKEISRADVRPDKPKYYLNVAYPYPSGAMHVGHGRTYTVPDVIARFKRMQGFNVLFPMAFHVTGSPVLGVSNRIARGDRSAIDLYRDVYGVPEDILAKFTDPHEIVRYFSEEYMRIMNAIGYTIDWRRRFFTIDPQYSKFITWQYNKLKERGLVVKGKHPVKYCPMCDNPVGDHDLLDGEDATILKFLVIKFRLLEDGQQSEYYVPVATLRPETIFGVTNMWVNTEGDYVHAVVNGEKWIISRDAADKMPSQGFEVKVIDEFKGEKLAGKKVVNPMTGNEVEFLPAPFVRTDMATGLVMSVPAHAPFDYVALVDFEREHPEREHIEPIPVIKVEGYGEIPAKTISENMGIKNQNDPLLRKATEQIYGAEQNKGIMVVQGYEDMSVKDAIVRVEREMLADNRGTSMYEFSDRPVVCRCNTPVYVRILEDQWFLDYSNEDWKHIVKDCLEGVEITPGDITAEFYRTVDWLREWACTRRVGLGTKLPWDQKWIIEPLSDSTIYMAYYTIAHHLKSDRVDPEKLDDRVFDYVFLGTGKPKIIESECGVPADLLEEMKNEFNYWYPYDQRFSAKDLISNHLTFQLFHHTAVFPGTMWPKGMVVFGMGLLEGGKMSSSKGNVVLLDDAMKEYGADTTRLFLMGSAEPWQDFDWRSDQINATRRQLERFWNNCIEIVRMPDGTNENLEEIDRWILHRMQRRIKEVTEALEAFQTRQALQSAYYGLGADVRWYKRRANLDRDAARWTLKHVLDCWLRMLTPFIPHVCEELWGMLSFETLVSTSEYPTVDESMVDEVTELYEALLRNTHNDIAEIIRVTKIQPNSITLYTAPEWKVRTTKIALKLREENNLDMKTLMPQATADHEIKKHAKELSKIAPKIIHDVRGMSPEEASLQMSSDIDELRALENAVEFFSKEFDAEVRVMRSSEADEAHARKVGDSRPMRPAIYVE